jgi:hypothetical protein
MTAENIQHEPAASTAWSSKPRIVALRRRKRRRKTMAIVATATVGLFAILFSGNALLRLPWRVVTDVAIVGAHWVNAEVIREVSEVPLGAPLFGVDVDSVILRVESISWVSNASVKRSLSGRFTIKVVERNPVGIYWLDGFHLVDAAGIETPAVSDTPPDVPLITGVPSSDSLRNIALSNAGMMLETISRLATLEPLVSELALDNPLMTTLILSPNSVPVWMPRQPGKDRFVVLASVLASHPDVLRSARYVDARFVGHVAIRS